MTNHAERDRLGHVKRVQISQIVDLLNMAPKTCEALLHLPQVEGGRDYLHRAGGREGGELAEVAITAVSLHRSPFR